MGSSVAAKKRRLPAFITRLTAVASMTAMLLTARADAATVATVQSGDWTNAATWGGSLPRPEDAAEIAAGHTVTLNASSTEVTTLTIRGTLRVARDRATRLAVRCNLIVYGTFDMGREGDPIPRTAKHDLVFRLTQARAAAFVGGANFAATDCGLWVMGRFDAHGGALTRAWGKLNGNVAAGTTVITVDGDVSDWPVGGQIVLTHTSDGQTHSVSGSTNRSTGRTSESEYLTIAAVRGSTITVTAPTRFAHSGTAPFRGEVGLLTRNVTISTELEGATNLATDIRGRKFAHVMFMPTAHGDGRVITHSGGANGNVQYVAFRHMGHYGKDGRFALHYHRLGNGSRGMQVRGVSWFESGFRCTNIHESNGMVVEDTVCVNAGGGAAHMVQTDSSTQQADSVFVHNLVTGTTGKHFVDRNTSSIAGERLRAATGFWPGASEHEAHLGNVSAGPSLDREQATGFHWPEEPTSTKGTIPRVFVANEAHSHTFAGFHSWQNRDKGHDIAAISSWGNSEGFLHGAYGFELSIYNSLFARQRIGHNLNATFVLIQDSTFIGRGAGGTRLFGAADRGVSFSKYSIQPNPFKGSRYQRNTFRELTPDTSGRKGTAIWRDAGSCSSSAEELAWASRSCSSSFPRIAQNTFASDVHPYRFGWSDGARPFFPNVNSIWLDYDRKLVLLRKDQKTPQGQFPPRIVNAASFYDSVADALATPFASLPSSITYTKLLDYRNRPYPDFTLRFDYDSPPTVAMSAQLSGTQLKMTAPASADTRRVEFWVDWVLVATDTTAPFEAVVDLARLAQHGDILPARRWAYAYARAFDGTFINRSPTDAVGYEQRAYSTVIELSPEARRQGQTTFFAQPQLQTIGAESGPSEIARFESMSLSGAPVVAVASASGSLSVVTAEQEHLRLAPVLGGLNRPSDLAVAPDGSIFIAERAGTVRVVRNGGSVATALDLSGEVSEPGGGLLAIALDPTFETTQTMYALYAADMPRGGREFLVARVRYVNGAFGERAVLLRTPVSTDTATGALRVGPDGKLYVALGSSADDPLGSNAATYTGKVLRVNVDGSTPDDQPRSTPIYSVEHPQPHALAWQPATGDLWVVDRVGVDGGRLTVISRSATREGDLVRRSYALPAETGPASAAFYRSDVMSIFTGDLFVAAASGRELLRLRFDPGNASRVISMERLLKDEIGALRVVVEGRDGGLYVATDGEVYRLSR
jgi:glucose/arabinose dehydrogenase